MPLPLVRLRYGLVTRRHPYDDVVDRLQNHGFPTDPATQATGLRLLTPVGLSPTERASLCWTHNGGFLASVRRR